MSDGGHDLDLVARQFERQRARLQVLAQRILGSRAEAEDAVQEAWLRLSRSETEEIDNLAGWLTTVVSRVCLTMLHSRAQRGEDGLGEFDAPEAGLDPEQQVVLDDSIGAALVVVLDTLAPSERLAFVLHDLFAVPFDEIATVLGKTPAAARQLASRARRRMRTVGEVRADRDRQRVVVEAFLSASRGGDFAALLRLLDPEVVLRADAVAVASGAVSGARGARAVAEVFAGRAKRALPALIDGLAGAIWAVDEVPRVVFEFTVRDERIIGIELLADPDVLGELRLELIA
ncbi:sigma-70 family RNA polymerase sigma factor [Nocardia pseudobrasiliensis]|uniref:RNA polymerase ECF family sigma subunit n=1 Tax=Nocardia pseudobrasiliensis TaxID=45979 RepID=A0A370HMC6_9NOCA|nr:sigma-70 family RNA polymerase sigma factor [Nocardia pseudobrasiliensis]RDI59649.1 RNA polymerase ECF family sigma subunit [Nocardia pseudobrasiliensis]